MPELNEIFPDPYPDGPPQMCRPKQRYAVALGEEVTVPCVASGNPKPDILWSKIGTNAEMDSRHGCLSITDAKGRFLYDLRQIIRVLDPLRS